MGNVEQAGAWVIANGAGSFTTVAERLALAPVYERWLKFRQSLGFEVVPTTGGPRPFGVLAQRLRAGNLVCMLADRDLSDTGVEVDFFGEKALMAAGSAVLAVRTGAALMPASCWFVGDTGWGIRVHDEIPVPEQGNPREKAAVMMQQLAAVFEQAIQEHPEDWHMLQRVFVADLDRERFKPAKELGLGCAVSLPFPGKGSRRPDLAARSSAPGDAGRSGSRRAPIALGDPLGARGEALGEGAQDDTRKSDGCGPATRSRSLEKYVHASESLVACAVEGRARRTHRRSGCQYAADLLYSPAGLRAPPR
jgi:hypothetical protein